MPARLFLTSGDLVADRRYDFARDLQLRGDLPAAADLLQQAIELAPNFVSAWFTLGEIREQLGERDAAVVAFQKARAADPLDRHGSSSRWSTVSAIAVRHCCSRRCCRFALLRENPPSSGAASISAAARVWRPPPL